MRLRLVGSHPTYLKYFYVNNEQMYVDLKNLVPENKMEVLEKDPLTHLEELFGGDIRLYNYRFGWITVEDNSLNFKVEKITGLGKTIRLDEKKFRF